MNARAVIACAGLLVATGGCLPDASGTTDLDEIAEVAPERFAVIELSAQHPRTSGVEELPTSIDAHFVEARGISRAAVVDALDVWSPGDGAGCAIEPAPAPVSSLDAEITLLDAGALGVSGNGEAARVEPRAVPAYIPQFRGVVYGGGQQAAPTYAHDEPYLVWTSGGDLPSIGVGVRAPAAVEWVDVNGAEPGSAPVLSFQVGDGLDVGFISDATDVHVALRSLSDIHAPRIECRLDGVQRLAIAGADIEGVFGTDARLELVARTATTAPLPPEHGLDGLVVYSFVDRLELVPAR